MEMICAILKENTPSRVLWGGRSLAGIRRRIPTPDASKWSPDLHHPTIGCFPFIPNKQVMSINLTTWSTMQNHVVVDHVVFNVIHSQVRYDGPLWGKSTGHLWILPPPTKPVMWKFDAFFVVSLNKLLNEQLNFRWFEMPWCSCAITVMEKKNLVLLWFEQAVEKTVELPVNWNFSGDFTHCP